MTDRTLDLTKALREAQLQRLEASLLARSATPAIQSKEAIKEKMSPRTTEQTTKNLVGQSNLRKNSFKSDACEQNPAMQIWRIIVSYNEEKHSTHVYKTK